MAVAPTYVSQLPDGKPVHVVGDMKEAVVVGTVGASDTYVTNGFSITPASMGLQQISFIDPIVFSTGHIGRWNPSTSVMQVFSAMGTELVNASAALQSATFLLRVAGK